MFVNGSTAIDGLSGRGGGFDGSVRLVGPVAGNAGAATRNTCTGFSIFLSFASKIMEAEGKRPVCIRVGLCGDIHRSRLREALQPGGDVYPVAQQVAIPHHHVANVNPDPELEVVLGGCPGLLRERLLHGRHTGLHRRRWGIRREHYPQPYWLSVLHAQHQPIHDLAMRGQAPERPDLILAIRRE